MAGLQQTFDCKNCGETVTVEFGTYTGGPLAYEYYAKCNHCRQEYNDPAEIGRLVRAKRAMNKDRADQ